MDYSLAIASLMKLEGAEEAIKVIEDNVKALREKAKQAEILEANVAKTLAENNVEGSDLKTQLETLSAKNKNALTEISNELLKWGHLLKEQLESQNVNTIDIRTVGIEVTSVVASKY